MQVPLNSLDIVSALTMVILVIFFFLMFLVLTHVLLNRSCSRGSLLIVTKICMLRLGVLHALNKSFNATLFLQDVETHLEDVVHLELVTEALLLEVRINIT